jgi:hypothetical protein
MTSQIVSSASDPVEFEMVSDSAAGNDWNQESGMRSSNGTTASTSGESSPTRPSVEHKVKSWPHLFEATLSGAKTHELRRADERDYQVGDLLRLQEWDPETQQYTGREMTMRITYITSAKYPCALSEGSLNADYCILSVTKAA